jgi:hypothetical protein
MFYPAVRVYKYVLLLYLGHIFKLQSIDIALQSWRELSNPMSQSLTV